MNAFIGFCTGILFAAALVGLFPGKNFEDMQTAIRECEKSLPHDMNCVVRAEPMTEKSE